MIEDGGRRAFGPKDEVLRETVQNHREIAASVHKGGGVS